MHTEQLNLAMQLSLINNPSPAEGRVWLARARRSSASVVAPLSMDDRVTKSTVEWYAFSFPLPDKPA